MDSRLVWTLRSKLPVLKITEEGETGHTAQWDGEPFVLAPAAMLQTGETPSLHRYVAPSLRSCPFDQPSQKGRPARQFRDKNMLVDGMGSIAHAAESVEGWDSQARCEISIGAAAHRRLA
jgi:hypothetical protein